MYTEKNISRLTNPWALYIWSSRPQKSQIKAGGKREPDENPDQTFAYIIDVHKSKCFRLKESLDVLLGDMINCAMREGDMAQKKYKNIREKHKS